MASSTTTVELTAREQQAIQLYDSGIRKGEDLAAALGITNSGAALKLVNSARRKLGREHEIGSQGGGGGRTRKAQGPEAMAEQQLAVIDDERRAIEERVAQARQAVEAIGSDEGRDEYVAAHLERLAERVREIQAEIKAVKADPSGILDEEAERRRKAVEAAEQGATARLAELDAAQAKWRAVLDALAG